MLSEDVKITTALDYAAGTADRTGAALDMQGWDGVLMVVKLATIATGGTNSIKAQHGDAANLSDAADLLGTGQAIADDDDNEVLYIDVFQPQKRYVRLYVDKDTSNSCAEAALYIQYKGKSLPSTHASGVAGEAHLAPAAGTA